MGILEAIFSNAKIGIQLSNQLIKVVFKDKGLFAYPVLMAIVSSLILFVIFVPLVLFTGGLFLAFGPVSLLFVLIVYYFVVTLVATYFLFALYIAFKAFIDTGKKMPIGTALSKAGAYAGLIVQWTIAYTIIRTVIKLIESQSRGIMEALIQMVAGIGLFLGTTFAVPIIYEERVGPIDAIKKSATFIINNLGKTFAGIIYFDMIGFVIKAIATIFIVATACMVILNLMNINIAVGGFTILSKPGILAIGITALIGIAIFIIGDLFTYVTLHLYYLVVYDYVRNGKVPEGMDETLIRSSVQGAVVKGGKGKKAEPTFGGLFQTGGDAPDMKDFVK